jgi:hypothetical protein
MFVRAMMTAAVFTLCAGWGDPPAWPVSGATPDEPVAVPGTRYRDVGEGTKSYRPVEPMPWGDANKRVAPKPGAKPGHDDH